jgi:hypothetical protein
MLRTKRKPAPPSPLRQIVVKAGDESLTVTKQFYSLAASSSH